MTGRVLRLLRIGRTVADLDRAAAFYCDALGFVRAGVDTQRRAARLRLGAEEIELAAFDPPGAPYPSGSTAADLWFQHIAIVTPDIAAAYQRLLRHRAVPITQGGPQHLPEAAGGVTCFKFRDPDGHPLELIQFPPGAGDPAWQRGPDALTIGIDHSALSVADADRSAAFYAGLLGLSEASRQVNSGPAQERLDGLAADIVDVVALHPAASATPHVELLGYREPRGRTLASPLQPDDIAADRLVLEVQGLEDLLATLRDIGASVAHRPLPSADGSRAAVARDPDGHLIVLVEQPS